MDDLIQAVHTRQQDNDKPGVNYIHISPCSETQNVSEQAMDIDLEKCSQMPNSRQSSRNNTIQANISILTPLFLALGLLFYTNFYIRSPCSLYQDDTTNNNNNESRDTGRIAPLILILNVVAPGLVSKVLDVRKVPSWGFGALAWSLTLVVPRRCSSVAEQDQEQQQQQQNRVPKGEEKKKEKKSDKEAQLLPPKETTNSSYLLPKTSLHPFSTTSILQLIASASYTYYTPAHDVIVVLHVFTSLLLLASAAYLHSHLHTHTNAKSTTTTTLARMLIPGAFLCQALLFTQLSDQEGVVLFVVMGVGMVGNVAVVNGERRVML